MKTCALLLGLLLAMACTPLPDLDEALTDEDRAMPYPELSPVPAPGEMSDAEAIETGLEARADGLRARAQEVRNRPHF